MSWLELEDCTVFLTGAAGGIGEATARAFAEQGARLALFDRDAAALDRLAAQLPEQAVALPLDLGKADDIAPAFDKAASQIGPPDILINMAATSLLCPLGDLEADALTGQFMVNTVAPLLCARAFKRLRNPERPGAIVNVSSIAAEHTVPNGAGYSSSKAALTMLTRQLAVEWGPEGIRCNSVSPGLILTPLSEAFYRDPQDRAAREAVVPSRRIGRPEDIAQTIMFLSSVRSDYVNGADLVVDGGFTRTLMTHIPRKG